MRRDNVINDHRVVRGGHASQCLKLCFGAQLRVDVETDAIKIAINRGRIFGAQEAARPFQRAIVNTLNADSRQRVP